MSMRYRSLSEELKQQFGHKVIKLSIDAGFSCPNRDGLCGDRGCLFCSEQGSGEFGGSRSKRIREQMDDQVELLYDKWPNASYIAYFQSFTNTYADVVTLRRLYEEALSYPKVVGLAIATRPDCLDDEVLDLLSELNERCYVWIELGLQSIHESSAVFLRRGYPLSVFETVYEKLHRRGIRCVVHTILGLPTESKEDMLQTMDYLSSKRIWGIKLHMLNVLRGTDLAAIYEKDPFPLLSREEYVELVCEIIAHLEPNIVLHRITGDGAKELLIAPHWILDKRGVLNAIGQNLKRKKILQGCAFTK